MQEFYEPVVVPDLNIAVFGAGHVGSAVVSRLSGLDCNIRWIDSRRNFFRDVPAQRASDRGGEPALEVAAMPPDSYYLVMTHSHALDFEICDRILRRGDVRYCGLIGSMSKRRRFEKALSAAGHAAGHDRLARVSDRRRRHQRQEAGRDCGCGCRRDTEDQGVDAAVADAEYPDNVHPDRHD